MREWFNGAKPHINRLPPPLLALLRRFLLLRVRPTSTPTSMHAGVSNAGGTAGSGEVGAAAEDGRQRCRALLAEVQAELRRVDRAASE